MGKIRLLLIEDNRILREGFTAMINGKGVAVTAAADAGATTLGKIGATKPQVALLDLGDSTQNSVEAVETTKKVFPGVKVIGMGLMPDQADILEFVQAGAEGFILKNATVDEVVKTIQDVAQGETVLPTPMTGSLFSQVAEHALLHGKRKLKLAIRMTKREKEVIASIVDGLSNKEIGEKLGIATFTVKSHVHNIMEKLGLHSRLQIANHARNEFIKD